MRACVCDGACIYCNFATPVTLFHSNDNIYYTDLIKEEGLPFDNTDDNPDFSASQLYAEVCVLSSYQSEIFTLSNLNFTQYDFCKQDVPEKDIKVVRQQIEEATEILNIVIDELVSWEQY